MERQPYVSVVTTTYQLADYLPQCIEGVLGQTYPRTRLQFVLVDDASTDATPAVVSRYGDDRLEYRRLAANVGPTAARNYGVNLAEGEWIAFLDADDYWLPERIAAMVSAIRTETDLATSDFYFEDHGVVSPESSYRGRNLEWLFSLTAEQQLRAVLEDNFLAYSMMMVPRLVLNSVGVFNESLRVCQDWDLWLRCLAIGSRVVCADEPLGVYRRMRAGSITSTESDRHVSERLKVLQTYMHLCSRRRSSTIRGHAAYGAFREAVHSRNVAAAAKGAFAIALNPLFLLDRIERRRLWGKDGFSRSTPLNDLRESLTKSDG